MGRTVTATATRTYTGGTSEFIVKRTVADGTPPGVLRVLPVEEARNISPATNVTTVFSEAMRAHSINTHTVTLRIDGHTQAISATVAYDAANRRAILNPAAPLGDGTTYVVTRDLPIGGDCGGAEATRETLAIHPERVMSGRRSISVIDPLGEVREYGA